MEKRTISPCDTGGWVGCAWSAQRSCSELITLFVPVSGTGLDTSYAAVSPVSPRRISDRRAELVDRRGGRRRRSGDRGSRPARHRGRRRLAGPAVDRLAGRAAAGSQRGHGARLVPGPGPATPRAGRAVRSAGGMATPQHSAVGYLVTAVAAIGRAITRDPFLDPNCWSNCTDNIFLVASRSGGRAMVRGAVALGGHDRRRGRGRRRDHQPRTATPVVRATGWVLLVGSVPGEPRRGWPMRPRCSDLPSENPLQ